VPSDADREALKANNTRRKADEKPEDSPDSPRERRRSLLRSRLPQFGPAVMPKKIAEEYAIFFLQEIDKLRTDFDRKLGDLELKATANKLGLDQSLPSVDEVAEEIETLFNRKIDAAQKKQYFIQYLARFGPDKAEKIYDLGMQVFGKIEKTVRRHSIVNTIRTAVVSGVVLLLGAAGVLYGVDYITKRNSTSAIQKRQEIELSGQREELVKMRKQLALYQKELKSSDSQLTELVEKLNSKVEEYGFQASISYSNAVKSSAGYVDSRMLELSSNSASNRALDSVNMRRVTDKLEQDILDYKVRLAAAESALTAIGDTGRVSVALGSMSLKVAEIELSQEKQEKTKQDYEARISRLEKSNDRLLQMLRDITRTNSPPAWTNEFRLRPYSQ